MNLYQKLLEIQQSCRGLGKDKAGLNYRYVSGDKILNHVRAKMDELGLLLKQEITEIINHRQDYTTRNGNRSEILSKVLMRFTWVDCESGETDVNLFGANGQNDWDKGVGSALTYAERYFLLKFFHIPTDEDDIDNPDSKKQPTDEDVKSVNLPEINEKQYNAVLSRINKGEKLVSALKSQFTLPNFKLKILEAAEKNYKPTS